MCKHQNGVRLYPKGTISQSWLRHQETMNMSDYLLLWNPIAINEKKRPAEESRESISPQLNNADSGTLRFHAVMEYCCAETTRVMEKFVDIAPDRPSTTQVARNLAVLCVVNDQVIAVHPDETSIKWNELSLVSQRLIDHLSSDLARIDSDQDKMDAVLLTIAEYLPCFYAAERVPGFCHYSKQTLTFILKVWDAIECRERPKSQVKLPFHQSLDTMDFDDDFESQIDTVSKYQHLKTFDRDHHSLWSEKSAFRISMAVALKFISSVSTQIDNVDTADVLPTEFLEYMINLPSSDLIQGWQTIYLILKQVTISHDNDMLHLLEHVTEAFLTDYSYNRHEVGLSACLDILRISPERWSKDPSIAYGHLSVQTYDWFLTMALKNNLISPKIVCKVVDLLFQLAIHQGTSFKPSDTAPALHDVILELLGADFLVRFHLAEKLPRLFEQFPLGEHENIFQGIFERMPLDPASTEGMVIRILVLSRIASRWHTLLRRGIYHIFEAAGKAEVTTAHARYCVDQVCSALSIQSPQDLFKFFVSQLLYTWLTEDKWESIPFRVFGYSSLEELLHDINDEVVGQALIHGGDNGLSKVSELTGKKIADLVSQQLAKAAAYSFAIDSQRRKTENNKGLVEQELRGYLDPKRYSALVLAHYPRIIAILFSTLNSDEDLSFIKTVLKDKDASKIGMRLSDIRNFGCSSSYQYLDQQPRFSTRYLLNNIERLCRRAGRPYVSIWSESVYVYVLRYLLQTIQPALGSSHACSVLRKIRLLIAIAGKAAFQSYALEMTVHAVQPFLVDQQCANDAIGIVQYLLEPSVGQLTGRISFVSGFMVWSMVSLQQFSIVPQDSTTQENDYLDTLSKAETFGQWLLDSWCANYITTVERAQGPNDKLDRFKGLINRASSISKCDPTQISVCKADILMALLDDRRSESPLLTNSMQDPILALVCSTFEYAASTQNSVLGDSGDAVNFAPQLWEICITNPAIDKSFLLWSSKVVGRAQHSAARLELAIPTTNTSHKSVFIQQDNTHVELEYHSTSIILQALLDVLFSTTRNEVGFAEQSLRFMLSNGEARTKLETHIGRDIPREYVAAFRLTTPDPTMPFPTLPSKVMNLEHGTLPTDLTDWLKDMVVFYANKARNGLLQSLTILLRGVGRLAIELLAPILHLLLAEGLALGDPTFGEFVAKSFDTIFGLRDSSHVRISKVLVQALLYLREQPFDQQSTIQSSTKWLELDYIQVSRAAESCGMYTAALLFAESAPLTREASQPASRKRVSIKHTATIPDDLLRSIYEDIDEPDSFYGVHQDSSLNSVMERLEYENDGYKSLLFNGARLDSQLRRHQVSSTHSGSGVVNALSQLNLNSIALAFQNSGIGNVGNQSLDQTLLTARKLEQWDVGAPDIRASDSAVLFKVFQGLHSASQDYELGAIIDNALVIELESALLKEPGSKALHSALRTISVLEEVSEVISCRNVGMIEGVWSKMWDRYTAATETQ
jgi:ataxia telangiectasia mutated family protein